ncbi:MAG: MarR family transcriptional regulator [Ectothiorhodospiraceae bacterium]|nr:MarR family transcriptional regulator [Ectothiorhodospiraceae bacterium]
MAKDNSHGEDTYSRVDGFGQALAETARAWRMRLDRRLQPLGLSQAKWRTLLTIARAGEGVTQKALAERMGVEGPTLVGLLDRLARDGWVERRASEHDRRVRHVYLTSRAREALREIEAVASTLRSELFHGLDEEELLRCMRVLRHLRDRAETLND